MDQESILSEVRQTSELAEALKGSEIIKLAGEVKARIAAGSEIYNYTIGDFNSNIFPIPKELKENIIDAYEKNETNYPASNGIAALRESVSEYISNHQGLNYSPEEYLISGGARPLIYAAYQAILDQNEKAIFPVPSWNNNHYTTLTRGEQIAIETAPEHNFLPTASDLIPHIESAGIIALCSPLNPTGTLFTKEALTEICELVLTENKKRKGVRKPLYIIYDQIYWQLCLGENEHWDPVKLMPEMKPFTIYIDGISKAFASTGVRVGWAFGPSHIINKMKAFLGHIGAWAPKPEQVGTARFLNDSNAPKNYLNTFKSEIHSRLKGFYDLFQNLKKEGMPVDVITPQAAIYLTVKIDLIGQRTADGDEISSIQDTTKFILDKSGIALVPFSAFGASNSSPWYRLSIGTSRLEDIPKVGEKLRAALKTFNN